MSKKILRWAALSLLFLFSDCRNLSDCLKVKYGEFYYYSKAHRTKVLIKRVNNFQIETDTRTGNVYRYKIVWKSDCIYDAYFDLSSKLNPDKIDSLFARKPISVDIINMGKDYYVCIAKMKPFSKMIVLTDTIYFQK